MTLKKVKEGRTEFYIHSDVFYNPVMELARDLSILVVSSYQKKHNKPIKFGDMLAAAGVRGLRVANEVANTKVFLNDKNPKAFELIKRNIKYNKLENAEAFNKDANIFVLEERPFDVIDIDPFGEPTPFLDNAVRSLYKRGLLCVTATDLPVLVGLYPQTCYRRYGVRNFKTEYFQEIGLRVLLSYIIKTAAKYDFYIKPLTAHSTDHYVRVYCLVSHGAKKANRTLEGLGFLLHCSTCGYRELSDSEREECPNCKSKLKVIENLWIDQVWDSGFCELVLRENESYSFSGRVDNLLRLLLKDSKAQSLYYNIHKICKRLKTSPPKTIDLLNRLKGKGYDASRTHFDNFCIKTDAPINKLKQILKVLSSKS